MALKINFTNSWKGKETGFSPSHSPGGTAKAPGTRITMARFLKKLPACTLVFTAWRMLVLFSSVRKKNKTTSSADLSKMVAGRICYKRTNERMRMSGWGGEWREIRLNRQTLPQDHEHHQTATGDSARNRTDFFSAHLVHRLALRRDRDRSKGIWLAYLADCRYSHAQREIMATPLI